MNDILPYYDFTALFVYTYRQAAGEKVMVDKSIYIHIFNQVKPYPL